MKVHSITFLNDYKQFKKEDSFNFYPIEQTDSNYDNLHVSILIGRNGSGKTTLMSLMATFFHNLERYGNNIPADFEINYSIIYDRYYRNSKIKHFRNRVYITIEGYFDNVQLLPKRNAREYHYSLIDKDQPYTYFENIRPFLPNRLVTSAFSFHGEYPTQRPSNFMGETFLFGRPITNIYGKNHYDIGSISKGIYRFIKLFNVRESKLKDLLTLFGLEFTNHVRFNNDEDEWTQVDLNWFIVSESTFLEENEYLNDLLFIKNGKRISLNIMSSGEKMLLLRIIVILNFIENNSIIIIEEPELHLDPVWNKQLPSLFKILFKEFNSHLFIATHSFALINSVSKQNLTLLDAGRKTEINENTFLAAPDELFRILYGENYKLNIIEDNFLRTLDQKNLEELQKFYDGMGNSIYKYLTFKKIKEIS